MWPLESQVATLRFCVLLFFVLAKSVRKVGVKKTCRNKHNRQATQVNWSFYCALSQASAPMSKQAGQLKWNNKQATWFAHCHTRISSDRRDLLCLRLVFPIEKTFYENWNCAIEFGMYDKWARRKDNERRRPPDAIRSTKQRYSSDRLSPAWTLILKNKSDQQQQAAITCFCFFLECKFASTTTTL